MKIKQVSIDDIKPYKRNARDNKRAIKEVMKSIKRFGFQQPIVVDENNEIVVGHTRFQAAKDLGLKEVPVKVADGLTPQEIKAYRIADNRTSDFSEWDHDLLKDELEQIMSEDPTLNMEFLGFNTLEELDLETFKIEDHTDKEVVEILIKSDPSEREKITKLLDASKLNLTYDVQYVRE